MLYARRIHALVLRRLGDLDEAETVVSDTLLEISRHPSRFRGESRFNIWLLGIARYTFWRGCEHEGLRHNELDEAFPDQDLGSFEAFARTNLNYPIDAAEAKQ